MLATHPILLPALVLVALTFVVMVRMYRQRVAQMKRERIHPQAVATSAQSAQLLTDSGAADHYRNLFELPVLFYFGVAVALALGVHDVGLLVLAWLFVALRVVHAVIHCGYNKVMHRFKAFLAGSALLLLFWIRLAWCLLAA
ncbi:MULTISPECIES: MAPEG family protein [unclassified Luteimonas]|uniref:MAPEG family protein n=1 Tax=unclassified Luteimonas TaxID=2629088 RepID=UPI00160498B9|nr:MULTISPECIES: MAPEG family protein [unclassified Luteimonas]MBB1472264.1 MAPEG family protein [Luteimonas sp. MC1782]MBB6599020.1 MAPEG family protein [Luteimonas sp. MC1825]QOC89155.1 MAPEG family protein [Luteimonas sp. MC1825]